jgi:hypothetical protein
LREGQLGIVVFVIEKQLGSTTHIYAIVNVKCVIRMESRLELAGGNYYE